MAAQFSSTYARATFPPPRNAKLQNPHFVFTKEPPDLIKLIRTEKPKILRSTRIHVSSRGDSYLDMWKKAVESERKSQQFEKIAENSASASDGDDDGEESVEIQSQEELQRKSSEFQKILQVPTEERDRVQRMQVVDRAAAAIAAAKALLNENVKAEDGDANVEDGEGGNLV